jgi:hypothetical protein
MPSKGVALRVPAGAAAICAMLLIAPAALAQPHHAPRAAPSAAHGDVEGTVVAIQGDELVLDLGADRGAGDGMTVEIWRPLQLRHPVTGKVLTDRFLIGTLSLVQVRPTLSLARASAALSRPAAVGDVVVFPRPVVAPSPAEVRAPSAPPSPPSPEEKPAAPEDPEVVAIAQMLEALRGADLSTRIQRYEQLAQARPEGRFSRALLEEAAALRELLGARTRAGEATPVQAKSFTAPPGVAAGTPLRMAVELTSAAAGAVLHLRRAGAASYAPLPMTAIGGGYFAVTLPADQLVGPTMDYFIEAVDAAGKPVEVVGTSAAPRELDVFDPPRPAAPRRLPARLDLSTDYADYNRLRGDDYAFQTEGRFEVRLGDVGVRAVRVGFGVYRGVGGSVNDLDNLHLAPRSVGFTYGYLEGELGIVRAFSLIGRVAVGLGDDGVEGGGQAMVRIGNDLKTNLLLGAEVLGGVGVRGIAELDLATFDRWPIVIRTEVTNQPAGSAPSSSVPGTSTSPGNIGGRGILQLGFKITPDFVVAARGSFEGRTIQHAGPGFGGAVGYSW